MARAIPKAVAAIYRSAPQPHRATMLEIRRRILRIVPNAQEVVSYGIAAFKVDDTIVCGLLHAKRHVGYYPFSGTVLNQFRQELRSYSLTKSALHVPVDKPLPSTLLTKLIRARLPKRPAKTNKAAALTPGQADHVWKALGLAAPARRALVNARALTLRDLANRREADVASLHGIGTIALVVLKRELKRSKLTFRSR